MAVQSSYATLHRLEYSRLLSSDAETLNKLYDAITLQGAFYLDLRASPGQILLSYVDALFNSAREVFDMRLEDKIAFDIDKIGPYKLDGYKPLGRNAGITAGKKDGFEAYLIPRDELCTDRSQQKSWFGPAPLTSRCDLLKAFMEVSHSAGNRILEAVAHVLVMHPRTKLTSCHRPDHVSTSALGLLKYSQLCSNLPELGHSAHTDVGTLTLLFCRQFGLQILNPRTFEWKYVAPEDGCCVVNVGDALRDLTGRRTVACLHRVVPISDMNVIDRFSCAYFMRPELDAELTDKSGAAVKSIDQHLKKYRAFRASTDLPSEDATRTGINGYTGFWEGESKQDAGC